jgi:heterodisulfide reductase subunit C
MSGMPQPDLEVRFQIETSARAESNLCWTCGSCDFECPINVATGRLRPQQLVRLANLGFQEELFSRSEIWYCLQCRRCLQVCPNRVKPAVLIDYVRREMVQSGVVSLETIAQFKRLFERFQRVRWRTIQSCLEGEPLMLTEATWHEWLDTPVPASLHALSQEDLFQGEIEFRAAQHHAATAACFTCGECSSACPVASGRSVFDPRTVFRMVNLGLSRAVVTSPSLWMCIGCQRCTDACSQLVKGHQLIRELRDLAIQSGAVDRFFPFRLEKANRLIYTRLLKEIDILLGFAETKENACILEADESVPRAAVAC